MNRIYCILSVCFGSLLFASCNSWLDVTPKGQVEAQDLFATTQGCNSAVGGIYYTLSGSDLYGQALSYGFIDILAQYWDFSANTTHNYYQLSRYDYTDQTAVGVLGKVWEGMYFAIAQCNAFIEYSAPYKEDIDNYDLLLGEVYALRAMAHMELFELFGPVIHTKEDLKKDAIAYRTVYNNISKPFDTGETVLKMASDDLLKAVELLKEDPIRDPEIGRGGDMNTSVINYQNVLYYRGARMNYFCALGLLARLEMLRQEPEAAYGYATRVLEEAEGIITLADKANIKNDDASSIYNFSTEMLGALYVNDLYTMSNQLFGMGGVTVSANSGLIINTDRYNDLKDNLYGRKPDGSAKDIRMMWFQWNQESSHYDFTKYREAVERPGLGLAYNPEVALVRLSEMYYIACETQIGKNNTLALEYLNDVRESRDLDRIQEVPDDKTLLEYLVREANKDFMGEGRMFLMYKRLFYDIYTVGGETVEANENIFVLPIPDAEYEFSGIDKKTIKK